LSDRSTLILLAEDDDDLRFLVMRQLRKLGFSAHYAVNGREAVQMAEQHNYDLILLDIMMPEMDGFAASRMIRELERKNRTSRTPIVALTAFQDKKRCTDAEMDDYLFKPVMLDDLANILSRWLGSGAEKAQG
jgi:CheY-like chemotaxis protein